MKSIKIYDEENEIYSGGCSVNTVLFRGRLYEDPKQAAGNVVKIALQLSNGKNKQTDEWNRPTFADCTAFGSIAKDILKNYKAKDEIWIVAKYYSKQVNDNYYKGFIVKEIIKEAQAKQTNVVQDDFGYLPF